MRKAFQACFVYSWNTLPVQPNCTEGVSQTSQDEMNYVESLLIYIFQQLNLSYNSVIVSPSNTSSMPQPASPQAPNPNALQPSREMGKACVINGEYFYSVIDYGTYYKQEHNITKNRKRIREKLNASSDAGSPSYYPKTHWLTEQEIAQAVANNSFVKYTRRISIS